jgi:hypothetical protein
VLGAIPAIPDPLDAVPTLAVLRRETILHRLHLRKAAMAVRMAGKRISLKAAVVKIYL